MVRDSVAYSSQLAVWRVVALQMAPRVGLRSSRLEVMSKSLTWGIGAARGSQDEFRQKPEARKRLPRSYMVGHRGR